MDIDFSISRQSAKDYDNFNLRTEFFQDSSNVDALEWMQRFFLAHSLRGKRNQLLNEKKLIISAQMIQNIYEKVWPTLKSYFFSSYPNIPLLYAWTEDSGASFYPFTQRNRREVPSWENMKNNMSLWKPAIQLNPFLFDKLMNEPDVQVRLKINKNISLEHFVIAIIMHEYAHFTQFYDGRSTWILHENKKAIRIWEGVPFENFSSYSNSHGELPNEKEADEYARKGLNFWNSISAPVATF